MKPYAIFEAEFRELSRTTALATMFSSFAVGFTTFGLSLFKDAYYATDKTAPMVIGGVVCLAFAAVFAGAAMWASGWKHEAIATIKKESGDQVEASVFGVRVVPK